MDNFIKIIVNDTIRMYKKCNIKMHKFVHSFCYTFESRLDKYKEEFKIKLELSGLTIKGTYEYFI